MVVYFLSGILISLTEVLLDFGYTSYAAAVAMIWLQLVFTYVHRAKL